MIFIWRRWGWLLLPAVILVVGLTEALTALYKASTGFDLVFSAEAGVLWGAGFLVAAPLVTLADLMITHFVDAKAIAAGAPKRPRATAFFIPVWIWGAIFFVIGLILIIANLSNAITAAQQHLLDR